jgi:hypothetical protein
LSNFDYQTGSEPPTLLPKRAKSENLLQHRSDNGLADKACQKQVEMSGFVANELSAFLGAGKAARA